MPTEALPKGRYEELRDSLEELREDAANRRQIADGLFDSIAMLLVDAIIDGDDRTLEYGHSQLKRLGERMAQQVASGETPPNLDVGRILGYIEITVWARQRIVPRYVLEQLVPGSNFRRILEHLATGSMSSEAMLQNGLADIPGKHLVADVKWLGENLLVAYRRLGDIIYWEITPKGREALHRTR